MNGSSYVFSKMLIPYQIFDPAYYPPDVKGSYYAFQSTDNYTLTCYAKQDSVITKIRFQRATDANFNNIIENTILDFPFYPSSSFSKYTGDISETFSYGHPDYFVRVRYEDSYGNGGQWSRTVLWRTQDSADATFNEEWPFTGHVYTYNLVSNYQGFYNVNSKMVAVIREIDDYYENNTFISETTNYYFYVFDENGNFIQKKMITDPYSETKFFYANGKKFYASYNPTSDWKPRLLIYDIDTNTYSCDVIGLPPEYSMLSYPAFYQSNVYYVAYRTDSGSDVVCYNPQSKTLAKVDLPNNINYTMVSQSFQDDGFWFDFDDGTYVGVAFAYTGTKQKTMAFSFNQFIQNFIRR